MSQLQSVADDLAFVRNAVARRNKRPDLIGVYATWALYVLIGYALIDYRPQWANLFFSIAWIPACLACWFFFRRLEARGEIGNDRDMGRRAGLHWGGGIVLALATGIALGSVFPALRGPVSGQITVCLIGLVYFLGGVHFDGRFLVLGPVMIAGGICLGFMPVLPWTTLGAVIALGLVLPSFFKTSSEPNTQPSTQLSTRTSHVEA